jgi:hypothetical protein
MNGAWATMVLSSFAPAGPGGLVERNDEVDWGGAWTRFVSSLNAKARLGARLALLIALTAPLWTMGRLASLGSLRVEERSRVLGSMLSHRFYLFRELTLMLKVCACLAMFRTPEVRARTSYDRPLPEDGERRKRLPVVASGSTAGAPRLATAAMTVAGPRRLATEVG